MKVLLVDDDVSARRLLSRFILSAGDVEIYEASSLATARQALAIHSPEVVLIDLCLDPSARSNRDGLVLLREVREHSTAVPIVVTVAGEMAEIREAMRSGAYTYILKDELCEELVTPVIQSLRTRRSLEQEILGLHGLVGTSDPPLASRVHVHDIQGQAARLVSLPRRRSRRQQRLSAPATIASSGVRKVAQSDVTRR